jgi:hypothetical protein
LGSRRLLQPRNHALLGRMARQRSTPWFR